jgi:hypothetical protein
MNSHSLNSISLYFTIPLSISFFVGYAIPAVNCVSSSGINACLEAARKNDAPIIIQFSSGGAQVRST